MSQVVAPTLLDISTDAEIGQVFALHLGSQQVVNFYFVDTISACGGDVDANIIGCGETPGQDFVVESAVAGDVILGALLLGLERGHNLGLPHHGGGSTFLMHPFLDGGTLLDANEVATIASSPLVHQDTNGQRFITINPVLIVDVPEPPTMLLLLIGLTSAGLQLRRQRIHR